MKRFSLHSLLFVLIISILLFGCTSEDLDTVDSMEGRFLMSDDGQHIFIDGHDVIIMGSSGEDICHDAQNGDRISISTDAINESYPASANVTSCEILEKGSLDELPIDTLDNLIEMGWSF